MSYQSFEQVLQKCHTEEKEFWQVILEDDMAERNVSEEDSMEHMRATWDAMLLAAATYEGNLNSSSGLVAAPISAWHPPAAPLMEERVAMICPIPAATYMAFRILSVSLHRF